MNAEQDVIEKQAQELFSMKQVETIAMMIAKGKDETKKEVSMFINEVQKMTKEFNGLKAELKPMLTQVKDHTEKHVAQYKMIRSLIGYMRDVDTKIDAIRGVLESEVPLDLDGAEFGTKVDNKWDELRGLRMKTDQEPITKGDVVWVTYKAEVVDGEKKGSTFEEEDFPVRVGSGSVAFEDMLENKFLNTQFKETKSFPKNEKYAGWEWAGNKIEFNIKVNKVKTSLPGVQ
jgi:hypothetical protein